MRQIIIVFVIGLLFTACNNENIKHWESVKKEVEMKNKIAENNKANTLAFLKSLEEKNIDALLDLFAENAVHINPYASGIFPKGAIGHEQIKAYWEPVFPNFEKMEFPVDEIYAMEDPSITFIKFKGRIKLKNDAGWYENDYYATFKFNLEGKITEYVEIFNPIVAARGFGLIDKIK